MLERFGYQQLKASVVKMSCVRWRCWRYWRAMLKVGVTLLYLVILLVFLPLLIWELFREHARATFSAWFVAGIFMLLSLPIFLWGLLQHLVNYTKPNLQKHIIRILWIVPIYSIDSWLGLKFPETAIYWNTVRETYEAYVLYNFLCYLLNFLQFEYDLESELTSRPPVRQPIPFCCCKPWPSGLRFIRWCKVGVLQYTVVQIITTILALITQTLDVYEEGHFKWNRSYAYIATANFVSVFIALHSLLYFYKGTKHLLRPINPVGKFLTIKAIIFFSFWQSVLIAILVRVGALPGSWKKYDLDNVALGLQNFLICCEMLLAAVAHYFVFSHKPFVDPAAAQVPCFTSCLRMLDLRDVYGDVKTHFVDPIPRPTIPGLMRSSTNGLTSPQPYTAEMTPLLHGRAAPPPSSDGRMESAEFSLLSYSQTETTHRRAASVAPDDEDGSDNHGPAGVAGEKCLTEESNV